MKHLVCVLHRADGETAPAPGLSRTWARNGLALHEMLWHFPCPHAGPLQLLHLLSSYNFHMSEVLTYKRIHVLYIYFTCMIQMQQSGN